MHEPGVAVLVRRPGVRGIEHGRIRRFALNPVRANPTKGSAKTKRKSAGWNSAYLREIRGLVLADVGPDAVPDALQQLFGRIGDPHGMAMDGNTCDAGPTRPAPTTATIIGGII